MSEFLFNIIFIIQNFIDNYYIYSFFMYLIFSIIFFTFSSPGGLIILLISGFFFGFIPGFLINIISITTGSFLFIIFSESLFKKIFNNYYQKYSNKLNSFIKNSSYEYLILLRLIIGPPLILQNIGISFLNISNKKILITSFIGFSPQMFLFSYVGSYASNIMEFKDFKLSGILSFPFLFILVIIILLIILRIFLKK